MPCTVSTVSHAVNQHEVSLPLHWHLMVCIHAGKKRKRYIQQPKPVQRYDLDVAAFEFSSTQQMHDNQPANGVPPLPVSASYVCSCLASIFLEA